MSRMGTADDPAFALGSRESRELMSVADVGRTIFRIAHQITGKTALDGSDTPRVMLLGSPMHGIILTGNTGEYTGIEVGPGGLDIALCCDDPMMQSTRPLKATSILLGGVDDVLYAGRSVHATIDAGPVASRSVCFAGRSRPPRTVSVPTTWARMCLPRNVRVCMYCCVSTTTAMA